MTNALRAPDFSRWLKGAVLWSLLAASGCAADDPSGNPMGGGCDLGLQICSGLCVDVASDPSNCGTCGTVCAPGLDCSAGNCMCSDGSCAPGEFGVDAAASATGGTSSAAGSGGSPGSGDAAPEPQATGGDAVAPDSGGDTGSAGSGEAEAGATPSDDHAGSTGAANTGTIADGGETEDAGGTGTPDPPGNTGGGGSSNGGTGGAAPAGGTPSAGGSTDPGSTPGAGGSADSGGTPGAGGTADGGTSDDTRPTGGSSAGSTSNTGPVGGTTGGRSDNGVSVGGTCYALCTGAATEGDWGWENEESCVMPNTPTSEAAQPCTRDGGSGGTGNTGSGDVTGGTGNAGNSGTGGGTNGTGNTGNASSSGGYDCRSGGSCPSSFSCHDGSLPDPSGGNANCGCYVVSGLYLNKKALLDAGAQEYMLASAMMETEMMDTNYAYGDNKTGDSWNGGVAKQNWGMMRECYEPYRGLGTDGYTSIDINENLATDVAVYDACRDYFGDRWWAGHRNGASGLQNPNTADIQNFKAAEDWTYEMLSSGDHFCDDVRFWARVQAIILK